VVGSLLYTVSDAGIRASALDSLADQAWLPFPGYAPEPPPVPEPGGTDPGGGGSEPGPPPED
jgi:hypothetical protein